MSTFNNKVLLKVESVSAGYGKRQVLFDISFDVKRGEVVLIVGGNGSGKSTVLKAIYGVLHDDESRKGHIFFDGEDITGCKPYQMIKKGLVYVPQKNNTFEQLTLTENLQLAASNLIQKEVMKKRINDTFEKLPQLAALKSRTPMHLSGGEKQQLALGMALIQRPKMILLDEPSAGLAHKSWQENLETIKALNQQGITFLIVEHMLEGIFENADNVLQMKLGRLESIKEGL